MPLIVIAREDPAAARSNVATGEGLFRTGDVRARLAQLLADEDRIAASRASAASRQAGRAVALGAAARGVFGLLAAAAAACLVRAVARPVRTVAEAATRIASGDLSTRVAAGGPPEIRDLTTAFNTMANSVEQSRRNLELQNEQLRQ